MSRTLLTSFTLDETAADRVSGFTLTRELGRPARLEIDVRFASDVAAENAVGKAALLAFGYDGEPAHEMVGVVEAVRLVGSSAMGAEGGGAAQAVHMTVVSQLGLLDGVVSAQIFQDLDVKEIVGKVLEDHGIAGDRQRWQLTGSYAKREYCVWYFESALAFVSRLLEEEGITFWSVAEDGEEKIVFSDDSPSASPIDGDAEVAFRGQRGGVTERDAAFALRELAQVRSGKFTLRDYDFKRPSLDMTVSAESAHDADLERYDYPGLYVEPSVGKQLATVRLEAEQVERETTIGLFDCPRLDAGRVFTLIETPVEDMGGELLVTKVLHAYGSAAPAVFRRFGMQGGRQGDVLVAEAFLIPKATKFRTAQTTPRPVIHGPQTARVVAPQGAAPESIHTDEHGRCKVKFPWDLGPDMDDKASCWMRVAQLQTSGSMILPRIDWEVVVEFAEGNPDRPFVAGKLYNGLFMPPYALPEGKTRTAMRTNSTPGGGGSNEIRLEDRAGGEEIMIHAQHDQTMKTANNKTSTVGNNATRVVAANETIDVSGNQTTKITMGSQTTVGGDNTVSVGGNRNTEVNAVTAVTVGGSQTIDVGGNHFEMDGNPLEALLAIATELAVEAAQAAASQALDRVNAAVQSRVDQAMAPINDLVGQAQGLAAGMEAVQNGDVGAIAGLAADAAGLPMPPGFGGDAGGGESAGRAAPAGAGGEGGGGGEGAGRGEGGDGGGDGPTDYTGMLGINSAVDSAIDRGIRGGSAALGEALGLSAGGGGGQSTANVDGPAGDVAGVDQTDRTKGPGHSTHKVDGSYSESTGALRISGVLMGMHQEISGNLDETVAAAKLTATFGGINESTGGNKTVTALGQLTFSKGDDTENSAGAATAMIGGLVYDKIKGGYALEAGAPATFIGAFHKMEAATSISFTCGASSIQMDDSGVTITSPLVTILAGKIQLTKAVTEN